MNRLGQSTFSILPAVLFSAVVCFWPAASQAISYERNAAIVHDSVTIPIFGGQYRNGATVAAADVNGDGEEDLIVGAGPGGGPHVEIYTASGTRIGSFFAYDQGMTGGLNIAAGDVTGDGQAEIIVAPQGNFRPELRIFTVGGALQRQLLAFESDYTGGVRVAVLPQSGTESGMIIAASGVAREQEVRGFSYSGAVRFSSWYPHGKKYGNGLSVGAMWSATHMGPVLITGAAPGDKPLVLVHHLQTGKLITSWLAYPSALTTGINVAATDDTIYTAPARGGGSDVRRHSALGHMQSSGFIMSESFRGGVEIAALYTDAGLVLAATPSGRDLRDVVNTGLSGKRILVDLSDQQMKLVENGKVISVRTVSTGKWSTPTPVGAYKTKNKITTAYSKPYALYMEYWMAFTPDGSYGLHSLPYWKLKGGGKVYEGASHLGTPVSHGCIRQSLSEAKFLFDWAPVGTPVVISK